jgi:hypothetical protein
LRAVQERSSIVDISEREREREREREGEGIQRVIFVSRQKVDARQTRCRLEGHWKVDIR